MPSSSAMRFQPLSLSRDTNHIVNAHAKHIKNNSPHLTMKAVDNTNTKYTCTTIKRGNKC